MSAIQQIVQLLKKDVLALRLEVAGLIMTSGLLLASMYRPWDSVNGSGMFGRLQDDIAVVLLLVAWIVLIIRVVQSDPTAARHAFWLTRPYSRLALLVEKLIFIAAFVHLPLLLAQWLIVKLSGIEPQLTGLIANQLALAALISLPVALVAALTTSLSICLGVIVITVAAVGAWLEISLVYLDVGWSEAALLAVLLVSLAASVLVWQYLARQTRRAALVLGTGCLLIAALLGANFFPAAGALEALIVGPDEAGPTLAIGEPLDLDALPPLPPGSFIPGPLFAIPLRASDADPRNFVLTDIELRLRNSDGYQYRIGAAAAYGNSLAIVFPAGFLQRAADTPLDGTIDFKLIQYRESAAGEINLDGSANTVAAGIQCGNRIAILDRWQLHCRSAAALPGEWEVVTLPSGMTVARLTRAAFPIRPTFSPVAARDVGGVRPGTAGAAAVTEPESLPVVIRELVSYERYSLKVQDLRLNDFRIENQVP